jgi:hypothetical protein
MENILAFMDEYSSFLQSALLCLKRQAPNPRAAAVTLAQHNRQPN